MAIYDFFLSRNGAASTPANYVGHAGRLFYESTTGEIRISDGATAGGLPIAITLATSTMAGGIKLGPGVTTNAQGQIIIDSAGLDFNFGDLEAITGFYTDSTAYALMQTAHVNEDMVLASNGTGDIKIVGQFDVFKTDGTVTGSLEGAPPIFRVKSDGQVQMLVPGADSTEGAVNIVGGLDGVFQAPVNTGVMLHITGIAGTPGVPSRVYNDAQNAFAAFVSRRYNNTAASPTAVLANEEIMRLSGTAHNGTIIPGTANQRIVYVARGNQTLTNQGGAIELWATPLNSITVAKVATVDSTGITLESGKVLTGNVTGDVSGTAGSVAAANITGTTLASNVVTSSLTTVGTLTNLSVTNTITGSVSGNAGTVTNGVYTTDTATVTNTMLAGSIANNKLSNSTISGIALGSNLAALTIDGYLIGTSYNGSTGVTISVDATTAATASKVVARDANAIIAGSNFQGTVRNAGAVGGTTVTLDFNTDHMVHCTFTSDFTVAFSNYTAGRTITLIATNTSAADSDVITSGIAALNTTSAGTFTVTQQTTGVITYYCTGTTLASVYAAAVYA
jgi:hypothetical protein